MRSRRRRAVAGILHSPRFRWLAVATGIMVVGAALASIIVVAWSSSASPALPVSSPSLATPRPVVPRFSRSEAEAAASERVVGVIVREASKLTTLGFADADENALASGGPTPLALVPWFEAQTGPDTQRVWLVAVAGSFCRCYQNAREPQFLPPGSIPWIVLTVDATTGEVGVGFTASPSSAQTWPGGWDGIHDKAGAVASHSSLSARGRCGLVRSPASGHRGDRTP